MTSFDIKKNSIYKIQIGYTLAMKKLKRKKKKSCARLVVFQLLFVLLFGRFFSQVRVAMPGELDHHLRRPIQEYQLTEQLLLQLELLILAHNINTTQQLEYLVDIRQLLKHDAIAWVQHPEAEDSGDGKNQCDVNTNNTKEHKINSIVLRLKRKRVESRLHQVN